MRVIRIVVDGRAYSLPGEQDADAIMGRITRLVRAGGGFMELAAAPDRALNVLVSPGMSLTVEVLSAPEPRSPDPEPEPVDLSWFDPFDMT